MLVLILCAKVTKFRINKIKFTNKKGPTSVETKGPVVVLYVSLLHEHEVAAGGQGGGHGSGAGEEIARAA